MSISRAKKSWLLLLSLNGLFCLTACLPEDTYLCLEYSPDGRLLAVVSEKKGLFVADPAALEIRKIAPPPVDPCGISWTSDSLKLAYASPAEGSTDIYLSSLDGLTTRITSHPARESHPMIAGDSLYYLTTESGNSEITSVSISGDSTGSQLRSETAANEFVETAVSSGGRFIAGFAFEDLRPQISFTDIQSGRTDRITSESDPLSLIVGPLAWSPDDSSIGYLRNDFVRSGREEESQSGLVDLVPAEQVGTSLVVKSLDSVADGQELVSQPDGISHPRFTANGSVLYVSGEKLWVSHDGQKKSLNLDLESACPEISPDQTDIAFIAAGQLIGITSVSLEKASILTFDLQEKFLLAEEYFRSGSSAKSLNLYEELAASVQRTRDPGMAKFVYIANLRRLGLTDRAVAEIESLLKEGQTPEGLPRQYLWRLLGFSYLLELGNLPKAADCFEQYNELTSDTQTMDKPESAINALEIIQQTSAPVASLYARAVKARLNGNFTDTDRLFGDLLTTAPDVPAIQREYMNALEGFDREVYYFSPTQRPFNPSRSQQADYLERFVNTVPDSPLARAARLNLFLLRIEMGSFSRARVLLSEALSSGSAESHPDGILEIFYNYLETPEPQPWINQAMPEVFLHPDIRPRLEAMITEPENRMLLDVVATKMALIQNAPDRARSEADAALIEWNRLDPATRSGEMATLYGRLLVLRAREAELRGLFAEAAEEYDRALAMLAEKQVDNFEFQEEIRYRSGLLRMLVADYPQMLSWLRDIEMRIGAELVNPTWEREALSSAIREFVNLYDSTSGTLRLWTAYETGIQLGKLKRPHQARACLQLTAQGAAPEFLQRKAILETAAIDEYQDDPWNAARGYARIAAMPGSSADVRLWCSYQIARLHLSINYKISAAREALALIVSTRPETPLAIQARELLVSTSTR